MRGLSFPLRPLQSSGFHIVHNGELLPIIECISSSHDSDTKIATIPERIDVLSAESVGCKGVVYIYVYIRQIAGRKLTSSISNSKYCDTKKPKAQQYINTEPSLRHGEYKSVHVSTENGGRVSIVHDDLQYDGNKPYAMLRVCLCDVALQTI
jgi:hypothetical protein